MKNKSKTSNKLFSIKKKALANKIGTIGVNSKEEILLLTSTKETDYIFDALFIPSKADFIKEQMKDYTEISIFDKKFNGYESFKGSHIEKLCKKYNLSIRMISEISGYLPEEGAKFIKDFVDKFEDKENVGLITSCFFLLGPKEYFNESYKNKELNTFIIFFRDHEYSRELGAYSEVQKTHVLTQIYSSGNDFSKFRLFKKYFDMTSYDAGIPIGIFTILLQLILMGGILVAIFNNLEATIALLTVYIIGMLFISSNFASDKFWNTCAE